VSHVLRHNCYPVLREQIVPDEIPSDDQPGAERGKEARRDNLESSVRRDSVRRRFALNRDGVTIVVLRFKRQSTLRFWCGRLFSRLNYGSLALRPVTGSNLCTRSKFHNLEQLDRKRAK
jgi:hypothetical protein